MQHEVTQEQKRRARRTAYWLIAIAVGLYGGYIIYTAVTK